ncbi:MAG: hypothetical protein KAW00_04880 [Dehalococcoidia bacterium]|nr:hypothetical protein [Dehalococcoidia bacterium]
MANKIREMAAKHAWNFRRGKSQVEWNNLADGYEKQLCYAFADKLLPDFTELGAVVLDKEKIPDEITIKLLEDLCDRLDADKDFDDIKAIGYALDFVKTVSLADKEVT